MPALSVIAITKNEAHHIQACPRHGDWYPDRVLQPFLRDAGRFSDERVHERLIARGPVGRLRDDVLHQTMASLEAAIDNMDGYSSGGALDRLSGGVLGAAPAHAVWAFCRCYWLRMGFVGRRLGLVLALHVAEGTCYRYLKLSLPAPVPRPN